jgi:hypothetical protein
MKLLVQLQQGLAATVLFLSVMGAHAQSSDALINKLVEKGILSSKEANQLRDETEKDFKNSYTVKTGMKGWVDMFKMNGDVRARYEGFFSDSDFRNPGTTNKYQWQDRNRFRYRLRFGVTASMTDHLEAGFMLASGQTSTSGGNPLSPNQNFTGNGANNYLWINQAYGKWSPLEGPDWTASLSVGKIENPFQFDEMVFDPNYTPTGVGLQAGTRLSDNHSLRLNAGGFYINESTPDFGMNPYLLGGQLRWDAKWTPKISSTFDVAYLYLGNTTNLDNVSVPNLNGANTRNFYGYLTNSYTPVVLNAAVTYTASSFPLYNGPFPIKVGGEVMYNLGAPNGNSSAPGYYSNTNFFAWNVGIWLGKSGKRGTWELSYVYKWVGADSWYEEFVDNDFGALYWQTPDYMVSTPNGFIPATPTPPPPPSPANPNLSYYIPGTNAKGHIVRFAYSPTDSLTLAVKWLLTTPVTPFPYPQQSVNGMKSSPVMSRVQVDATWKF